MGNAENGAQPQLSKRAQIANPFRAMVFGAMADEMIADGTDEKEAVDALADLIENQITE